MANGRWRLRCLRRFEQARPLDWLPVRIRHQGPILSLCGLFLCCLWTLALKSKGRFTLSFGTFRNHYALAGLEYGALSQQFARRKYIPARGTELETNAEDVSEQASHRHIGLRADAGNIKIFAQRNCEEACVTAPTLAGQPGVSRMAMWKVIVSPDENENAWEDFVRRGIIGIGWCNPRQDDRAPVQQFVRMRRGDWVVAHLSGKRSGVTFLAVGVGRLTSDYHEVETTDPQEWNGPFRRQFTVDWVSTDRRRMPDLFRTCNYRITVCLLSDEVEVEVMRRFGIAAEEAG